VEAVGLELPGAVIGEFGDEAFFAGVEGGEVGPGGRDVEPEEGGALGLVEDLGGVEESFGRHAAAEDAEAAEFGGAVNDGDAVEVLAGGAGGGVTGTAAAEDGKIKMLARGHEGERFAACLSRLGGCAGGCKLWRWR